MLGSVGVDENGGPINSSHVAWTGSSSDGFSLDKHCLNWQSTASDGRTGDVGATSAGLLSIDIRALILP